MICIRSKTGEFIEVSAKHVQFYAWSGWLEIVKNDDCAYPDSWPHTACLMLLAGF